MDNTWFQEGYAPVHEENERRARQQEENKKKVRRIWMKPNTGKDLVILDRSGPFTIREHQIKIDGSWQNWYTCVKPMEKPCRLCERGVKAQLVGFFTVLDCERWEDRQNNVYQYEKRLWPVKAVELGMFEEYSTDTNFRLQGQLITVKRTNEKRSASGDVLMPKGVINLKEEPWASLLQTRGKEHFTAFPYIEVLAPRDPDDIPKGDDREPALTDQTGYSEAGHGDEDDLPF